ncbi:glycosyltransferase family 2 protein [bacterium]|nr:glycosyltransferase family 2 protein [bacterium]
MNQPSVYVVILGWNGRELTLDCVRSVLKVEYPNFIVLVVDNHSSDGSPDAIRKEFQAELSSGKLLLVENSANLGFARGNNIGMELALKKGADYVLLLNNDTVVDPALLKNMIPMAEADGFVGIAAPKIYYFDPPNKIWYAGGKIALHKGLSWHIGIREIDHGQYDTSVDCDYATGCAMLIKKAVIEKIGFLDPIYPHFSEDADYCWRAKLQGFRILYLPGGKVWHKISVSTGGQLSLRKIRLRLRSNFIFFKRYARGYHWLTIPVFFILDGFRILGLILTKQIRNK